MIELIVNGTAFSGWTEAAVRASLDSVCREFFVGYTSGTQESRGDIREGDGCDLRTPGGTLLLSGFVDDTEETYEGTRHTLSCSGRSATGDIVDCSAEVRGGQWKNATIRQIVNAILQPFGTSVAFGDVDLNTTVRYFAVQEGEAAHECIERLARAHGFLWSSTPSGHLEAIRAGSKRTRTAIERGVNVVRGSRRGSVRDRFSSYSVVSQLSGDDATFGSAAAHIREDVRDDGVRRHRPLRIIAESQMSRKEVRNRAKWEMNVRYGRSQRLVYELDGWNLDEGGVWDINLMVRVRDQQFDIDEELLIASCELTYGEQGEVALVELVRPEAYQINAVPPKPKNKDLTFQ